MNRIEKKFRQLRKEDRKALIIYLTCGFPDLKTTEAVIRLLEDCGVDMIELGIPFSDPIADGPVIQYSSQKALEKGINLDKVFGMVSRLRKKTAIPLLIMSYLNPVYRYGAQRFFRDCARYGIDGVIIPDLIIEEGSEFEKLAKKHGIDFIYFISPVTEKGRRTRIYRHASGFTYILSVTGITGARKKFSGEVGKFLSGVRAETDKPLALGFGVSSPGQIKGIRKHVDGFIIGSALIRIMQSSGKKNLMPGIRKFVTGFKSQE
jgi:tryptophan synthase alpha chain